MKKENRKKGVFMVMSNANGWRNPKVFGGAEIKTASIINKIEEIDWYIVLPEQLYEVFSIQFASNHLHYLPLPVFFTSTNVIKDLFQGLIYTWKCVKIGWEHRGHFSLIYSATTNFSDIFPAKIISLITKKPYIVKYHISIYDEPRILRIYQNFREEKNTILDSFTRAVLARVTIIFLKKASCVLVVCKYLGKQLEGCGIIRNKIKVNYNGLDFDMIKKFRDSSIEKKYDICCIGRIEKNKGLLDIIDLIKNLRKDNNDISAVIIGDGSYLEELKNEIQKSNVKKSITVTGFLGEERYTFLQQSKLFVSPTYAKEGFGLTLLEALFFGVPIVAYTHPVFEEVFSGYKTVKLVKQNIDSLKNCVINELGRTEKLATSLNVLDVYSLRNCVAREKEILLELI